MILGSIRALVLAGGLAGIVACASSTPASTPASAPARAPGALAPSPAAPSPPGRLTAVVMSTAPSVTPCDLTAEELTRRLLAARALAEDDPQVVGWSYSPWCAGTLVLDGAPYRFQVFLGGLARLEDDRGARIYRLLDLTP